MTLYYLPLEPLDGRYTAQWYRWFKEVFDEEGVDYEYIDGEKGIEHDIGEKFFLDMKNTFVWKFEQMKKLFMKDLKDGDVIFITDIEYPGMEAIEYFKRFSGKDIKVVSVVHAATFDCWDLTYMAGLERYGKDLEDIWFDMSDIVFTSTKFHDDLIMRTRRVDKSKLKRTGLPVDVMGLKKKYKSNNKKWDIVFTGRLTIEKGWDILEYFRPVLEDEYGLKILVTHEHNFEKEEYYKEMGRSKVIFAPARQETFGYGMVEGMSMDLVPVVPDALGYTDYVPEQFRYKKMAEIVPRILDVVDNWKEYGRGMHKNVMKYQYQNVIRKMIAYIDELLK